MIAIEKAYENAEKAVEKAKNFEGDKITDFLNKNIEKEISNEVKIELINPTA